jgi:hypothetical protein
MDMIFSPYYSSLTLFSLSLSSDPLSPHALSPAAYTILRDNAPLCLLHARRFGQMDSFFPKYSRVEFFIGSRSTSSRTDRFCWMVFFGYEMYM